MDKKVVEVIKECLKYCPWGEVTETTAEEIAGALERENLLKSSASSEWISVEDRLPDKEFRKWEEELAEKFPYSDSPLEVIVQIDGASVATTLNYYAGEFYDNDSNFYDVTNWMPLPETPKRRIKKND